MSSHPAVTRAAHKIAGGVDGYAELAGVKLTPLAENHVAAIIERETHYTELVLLAQQFLGDVAGEQEDEDELAKSLGRMAAISIKPLRSLLAKLEVKP